MMGRLTNCEVSAHYRKSWQLLEHLRLHNQHVRQELQAAMLLARMEGWVVGWPAVAGGWAGRLKGRGK